MVADQFNQTATWFTLLKKRDVILGLAPFPIEECVAESNKSIENVSNEHVEKLIFIDIPKET